MWKKTWFVKVCCVQMGQQLYRRYTAAAQEAAEVPPGFGERLNESARAAGEAAREGWERTRGATVAATGATVTAVTGAGAAIGGATAAAAAAAGASLAAAGSDAGASISSWWSRAKAAVVAKTASSSPAGVGFISAGGAAAGAAAAATAAGNVDDAVGDAPADAADEKSEGLADTEVVPILSATELILYKTSS
jgi:hypothetical protein